jgi:glycosyltransferase involved in cell wall biosynthesis
VLSVLIATFNRAPVLERCLDALVDEEPDEIVVVDDGSFDSTPDMLARREGVRVVRQENAGRSAARNAGIAAVRGDVVLFLDDDVLPRAGLVDRHRAFHERHPQQHEALLGHVTWAPELEITRHMRWLERGGPLFAYDLIEDPEDVPWKFFYTANLSVKRDFLEPFDPTLPIYEDAELAYRLTLRGLRLRYDPEALGHHLREETPGRTERRMREVGTAAALLHAKWPELREPPPRMRRIGTVKAHAAAALNRLGIHSLDDRLDDWRASRAFVAGYEEGARRGYPAPEAPARTG